MDVSRGKRREEKEISIVTKEPTITISWHQLLQNWIVTSVWPYAMSYKTADVIPTVIAYFMVPVTM